MTIAPTVVQGGRLREYIWPHYGHINLRYTYTEYYLFPAFQCHMRKVGEPEKTYHVWHQVEPISIL